MITNIVDRRQRQFRWRKVNAVVEATSHDNGIADSDQIERGADDLDYDELIGASLSEAMAWAQGFAGSVKLYLYDEGDGPEGTVTVFPDQNSN